VIYSLGQVFKQPRKHCWGSRPFSRRQARDKERALKVLVTDTLAGEGLERFREAGFEVAERTGLTEDELVRVIPEYNALIVRSQTKVTARVIDAAAQLRIVGRAGTGLDNVDIDAATRRGIVVMNTPESNTISAAEHTISMLLALSRNIPQANESLKRGVWDRKAFMGAEVYQKVLGIIGLGRIGSCVARRAQGLGMNVVAYDPFTSVDKAAEIDVRLMELESMLSLVDYLTIHTPLTERTRGLIGAKEFLLMKPGVRVVNCARGGVVDEQALYEALCSGRVKGAALDVFENGKPFGSPLLELDSVIVTPHLGASTAEAQVRVAVEIAVQVVDALKNGEVRNAINILTFSPQQKKRLGGFLSLAEKMGSLMAQLIEGNLIEAEIRYKGDLAEFDVKPLSVAFVKGLLGYMLKESINYVNALVLAQERGIRISEVTTTKREEYRNLVQVTCKTDVGVYKAEGTILEETVPYVVRLDGCSLEFVPEGYLLVCRSIDKPGVVGSISTLLGGYGINISGLRMGTTVPGKENISVYTLDRAPSIEVIDSLCSRGEILSAKLVHV
jgi:D-3-phosphoglycerate dehydrogenase